jgi:hypothetical protein
MQTKTALIAAAIIPLLLVSCGPDVPTADQKDQNSQEDITSEAVRQVPLPTITHFAARRTLKAAYEAEDKQLPTYSYHFSPYHNCYVPLAGDAHTYGYPIPGATQMTNPSKIVRAFNLSSYFEVLPQADPDTTFKPASEDATLTMQLNPTTGQNDVTYSEPQVVTKTTPIDPKWICIPNVK